MAKAVHQHWVFGKLRPPFQFYMLIYLNIQMVAMQYMGPKVEHSKVGKLKPCYNVGVCGSIKLILGTAVIWAKTHLYNPLLFLSWQQDLCLAPFAKVRKLRPCYNFGV